MKRRKNFSPLVVSLILLFSFAFADVHAAETAVNTPPEVEWERSFGGSGLDGINSIRQTSDGGYIFAGASASPNDGDITGNQGMADYWIMKLDDKGYKQWSKLYGGDNVDSASDIGESAFGEYIVTGMTMSSNDVVGSGKGGADTWVVNLYENGELKWTKARSRGGDGYDVLRSIVQTPEGSAYVDEEGIAHDTYVLAGTSASNTVSGDSSGSVGINKGEWDFWVLKLHEHDDHYHTIWTKTYGGSGYDYAKSIQNTNDGGYIVGGTTYSDDYDVQGYHGEGDCWILKLDADGNIVWRKTIGDDGYDDFSSILPTSDGGYVMAGFKEEVHDHEHEETEEEHAHHFDYWVVKLDASGEIEWEKTYGDEESLDEARDIVETDSGGYIVVGLSESSYGGADNHGEKDALVVKLNASGEVEWALSLGGAKDEEVNSIQKTSDGGYIMAGMSQSNNVSDGGDGWVIKLAPEKPQNSGGTNGGCDAGIAGLALLAFAIFAARAATEASGKE
jgi:hypothetical protein